MSCLFLALVLLYVWHAASETEVIKRGWCHPVDGHHRCTLSIFCIGYDSLKPHPAVGQPLCMRLLPRFR
ncbi:MAG: hypothetical protein Kow0047_32270 [Anaerolineae bacterium]